MGRGGVAAGADGLTGHGAAGAAAWPIAANGSRPDKGRGGVAVSADEMIAYGEPCERTG